MEEPELKQRSSTQSSADSESSVSSESSTLSVGKNLPGGRSRWSQSTNWERFLWLLKIPLRTLLCASLVTVFFFTYHGLMLPILSGRKIWPRLYWFCEGKLYRWLQAFVASWGQTAGYSVYEYGDDISDLCGERVLVMCNHLSTADVPTVFAVLQNKGVASRKTLWLMDQMFRYTPFGVVGHMHGDYFVKQGKATRESELLRLKDHLRNVYWDRDRRWVILFPEGGFYCNRIESSQAYARKNGFPHTNWTTLPRQGAVKAILEEIGPRDPDENENMMKPRSNSKLKLLKDTVGALREKKYIKETRPPIKYVLDMTIAYPNAEPLSLQTLMLGTREDCNIAVNYKVYRADEVPFADDNELRDWMYKVYVEKDKLLDNYYREGVFTSGEEGTLVRFSWSKMVCQYVFWFTCAYVLFYVYLWIAKIPLGVLSVIFNAVVS
uniref:PlsC domain-containing protein n=1 Tax=Steinernema glaseri TaxID=37863 RepID=A0A1I7Y7W3_9BILA